MRAAPCKRAMYQWEYKNLWHNGWLTWISSAQWLSLPRDDMKPTLRKFEAFAPNRRVEKLLAQKPNRAQTGALNVDGSESRN